MGLGDINVPIKISGMTISPGDWIRGDESGVVVIPKMKAVEIANRAMDVYEKEMRWKAEIREGRTLGGLLELERWEKPK